ncbi:MAG: hypothetical protein AAGL92_10905 [Pseudomonadota bacterium]
MKRMIPILTFAVAISIMSSAAHAACTVEYKAKRDNPLKLFHNVATVPGPCDRGTVQRQLRAQLAAQGLTLLKILSVKG